MSKSTKIIAALGVAAGLGVAALPFGAFALEIGTKPGPVTTDVELEVTVNSAIAIAADAAKVSKTMTPNAADSGTSTLTVSTNDTDGYTLSVSGAAALTPASAPAGNGTKEIAFATAAVSEGDGKWNISYDGKFLDAATGATVKEYTTGAVEDDETEVTYNFTTAADQMEGIIAEDRYL